MNSTNHLVYILGSIAAAMIAAIGVLMQQPIVYGVVPGAIGAVLLGIASVRFFRDKQDLAGFAATLCGFAFYQAYQMNPLTLPVFTAYIGPIPMQDQVAGILLANLTTAMLLIACEIASRVFGGLIYKFAPAPERTTREVCDGAMLAGFFVVFIMVAIPNVIFGKVVVGAINTIIYQRSIWSGDNVGYDVFGGSVGGSFANATYWTVSLALLWLYLLRSRFKWLMWLLSPLVLIWTGAVTMQGSRTYLVVMAIAGVLYFYGDPRFGLRSLFYVIGIGAATVTLAQVSALFRTTGLQSFNLSDFSSHALEVQGNEGTTSQMDGIEYFRTEMLARHNAPEPFLGFLRGVVERPIEGALMVVPRSVFPWKPIDNSAQEFSLFYVRERVGVETDEAFLGASPGLIGRELIHYGFTGPITMLLWMGSILALADRLFSIGARSDFHRICAAMLVAFFIAQSRDFVALWFLPFLPGAAVLFWVGWRSGRNQPWQPRR